MDSCPPTVLTNKFSIRPVKNITVFRYAVNVTPATENLAPSQRIAVVKTWLKKHHQLEGTATDGLILLTTHQIVTEVADQMVLEDTDDSRLAPSFVDECCLQIASLLEDSARGQEVRLLVDTAAQEVCFDTQQQWIPRFTKASAIDLVDGVHVVKGHEHQILFEDGRWVLKLETGRCAVVPNIPLATYLGDVLGKPPEAIIRCPRLKARADELIRDMEVNLSYLSDHHRILRLSEKTDATIGVGYEGGRVNVSEYYRRKHHIYIQHSEWPPVELYGDRVAPLELVELRVQAPRCAWEFVSESSCSERHRERLLALNEEVFGGSSVLHAFSVAIDQSMSSCECMTLLPPQLQMGYPPQQRTSGVVDPIRQSGWYYGDRTFLSCPKERRLGVVNFGQDQEIFRVFVQTLIVSAAARGLYLPKPVFSMAVLNNKTAVRAWKSDIQTLLKQERPHLLVCLVPKEFKFYEDVQSATYHYCPIQCVRGPVEPNLLVEVLFETNAKLGGVNYCIAEISANPTLRVFHKVMRLQHKTLLLALHTEKVGRITLSAALGATTKQLSPREHVLSAQENDGPVTDLETMVTRLIQKLDVGWPPEMVVLRSGAPKAAGTCNAETHAVAAAYAAANQPPPHTMYCFVSEGHETRLFPDKHYHKGALLVEYASEFYLMSRYGACRYTIAMNDTFVKTGSEWMRFMHCLCHLHQSVAKTHAVPGPVHDSRQACLAFQSYLETVGLTGEASVRRVLEVLPQFYA